MDTLLLFVDGRLVTAEEGKTEVPGVGSSDALSSSSSSPMSIPDVAVIEGRVEVAVPEGVADANGFTTGAFPSATVAELWLIVRFVYWFLSLQMLRIGLYSACRLSFLRECKESVVIQIGVG